MKRFKRKPFVVRSLGPVNLYNSNNGLWAFRSLRIGRLGFKADRSHGKYYFELTF